jgi:hypothetical protein
MIWVIWYLEKEGLEVVDAVSISSVVCILPLPSCDGFLYVLEKLGLEVTALADVEDDLEA